jgi:hypothetical protein
LKIVKKRLGLVVDSARKSVVGFCESNEWTLSLSPSVFYRVIKVVSTPLNHSTAGSATLCRADGPAFIIIHSIDTDFFVIALNMTHYGLVTAKHLVLWYCE